MSFIESERPRRAGLGLPPAVIIRSGPAPLHPPQLPFNGEETDDQPHSSRWQDWKEWTVNPAKHGPERVTRAPVFVASKSTYDELGRSVLDGVEVSVQESRGEGKGKGREVDKGDKVAAWYTELSSRPVSGSSTPRDQEAGPSRARTRGMANEPIDLTEDVDEDPPGPPSPDGDVKPTRTHSSPETTMAPSIGGSSSSSAPRPPIRVHRREWFIRRALARQSLSSDEVPLQRPPPKPSSIGSLVNIDPEKAPRVKPAQYVLGPENRGYVMLKDRLGWEGGGLGRPEGWVDTSTTTAGSSGVAPTAVTGLAQELKREMDDSTRDAVMAMTSSEGPSGSTHTVATSAIVDLTADSDDENLPSGLEGKGDMGLEAELEGPTRPFGPGRTAPIATALKLDRLGIGHTRHVRRGNVEAVKRVTHTAKEIANAQRRARHAGKPSSGLQLGKKGKIKWKDRDKRDREHRQRLAAAINA